MAIGTLGSLNISLEASIGKFDKALTKADQIAKRRAANMRRALSGIGVALSGIAFTAAIKNAIAFGDAIDKAAKKTAISVTAFQEYSYAAGQSGVSTQTLEVALSNFNMKLGKAALGMGTLYTGLKDANPELLKMMMNAGSTEQALDLFWRALDSIEDPAQRAAVATRAFGDRAGPELMKMLSGGIDGLEELRKKAVDLGLVLSEETTKAAAEAGDAFDTMGKVVKTILTAAIVGMIGPLTDMVNKLSELVAEVNKANPQILTFGVQVAAGVTATLALALAVRALGISFRFAGKMIKTFPLAAAIGGIGWLYKEMGNEAKNAQRKVDDLTRILQTQESVMDDLYVAYEKTGSASDKLKLEKQIEKINKTADAWDIANTKLAGFDVALEDAGGSLEEVDKALKDANQDLPAFNLNLGDAGKAAGAAAKSLKKVSEETAKISEELPPLADRLAAVNAELDTMMGLDYSGDLFELADGFEAVEESAATAAEATINFSEALEENLSTAIESFLQGDFSGGIDDFVSGFVDDMRKQLADALAKCLIPANLMKDIICGDGASIVSETVGTAVKEGVKKIGSKIANSAAGEAMKTAGKALMTKMGYGAAKGATDASIMVSEAARRTAMGAGKAMATTGAEAGAGAGKAMGSGMAKGMAFAGPAMVAAGVVLAYMSVEGLKKADRKLRQEIRDNYKELLTQGMVEPAREVANELGQIAIESTAVQGLAYTRIGELGVAAYQALREAMQKHGITIAEVKDDFAQITGNVENFDAAVQSVNETQVESIQLMNRLKLKWDDGRGSTEAASLAMRDYNEIMGQVNNATLPQLAAAAVRNLGIAQSESEKLEEIMRDGVVTAAEAASVGIEQMGTKSAAEFSGLLREIEKTMKGIYESTAAANGLKSAIDGLQDKTVTVTTRHVDTYSGAHAASGERATGTYGQFFTVPPGYANDSYRMGLTSGEKVKVQTPGEQEQQGNSGVMSEIRALRFDVRALAERIAAPIVAAAYDTAESPIAV